MSEVNNTTGVNSVNDGLALAALVGKSNGYTGGGYGSDLGIVCTQGVCDLRHDVGVVTQEVKDAECGIRSDVKDAECNLRHDVKDSESNIRREVAKSEADVRADVQGVRFDVAKSECSIKDAMSSQNLALMNRLCEIEKQALKAEYEAKLTAQTVIKEVNAQTVHSSERLTDKVDHEAEELEEKLDHLAEKQEECCCEIKQKFCELREQQLESEVTGLKIQLQALNVGTPGQR